MDMIPDYRGTLLHRICEKGDVEAFKAFLDAPHQKEDLVAENDIRETPLHVACFEGHEEIVRLLLPWLDYDDIVKRSLYRRTALHHACMMGHTGILRILMPRVKDADLFVCCDDGLTPLDLSIANDMEAFELILAHVQPGEHMYDLPFTTDNSWRTWERVIEEYEEDPRKTRTRLRKKWAFNIEDAAECFALVVGLCDGYFEAKPDTGDTDTQRFFNIAKRLPMELQMLVCNRAFDCQRDIILSMEIDVAIAKIF